MIRDFNGAKVQEVHLQKLWAALITWPEGDKFNDKLILTDDLSQGDLLGVN